MMFMGRSRGIQGLINSIGGDGIMKETEAIQEHLISKSWVDTVIVEQQGRSGSQRNLTRALWRWLTEYVITKGKRNEQPTRVPFSLHQQKEIRIDILKVECWLSNEKSLFSLSNFRTKQVFQPKTEVVMVAERRLCVGPKAWAPFRKGSVSCC